MSLNLCRQNSSLLNEGIPRFHRVELKKKDGNLYYPSDFCLESVFCKQSGYLHMNQSFFNNYGHLLSLFKKKKFAVAKQHNFINYLRAQKINKRYISFDCDMFYVNFVSNWNFL